MPPLLSAFAVPNRPATGAVPLPTPFALLGSDAGLPLAVSSALTSACKRPSTSRRRALPLVLPGGDELPYGRVVPR